MVFISTVGIENYSNAQFEDLLKREQILAYWPAERQPVFAMPFTDASGNSVWSMSVLTDSAAQSAIRFPTLGLKRELV